MLLPGAQGSLEHRSSQMFPSFSFFSTTSYMSWINYPKSYSQFPKDVFHSHVLRGNDKVNCHLLGSVVRGDTIQQCPIFISAAVIKKKNAPTKTKQNSQLRGEGADFSSWQRKMNACLLTCWCSASFLLSYSPGLPAEEMVLPTVSWALSHHNPAKKSPHGHATGQPDLASSPQVTQGCGKSASNIWTINAMGWMGQRLFRRKLDTVMKS